MKPGSKQNEFKVFWQILWERLLLGDAGKMEVTLWSAIKTSGTGTGKMGGSHCLQSSLHYEPHKNTDRVLHNLVSESYWVGTRSCTASSKVHNLI
jgi:hypothetical protein